MLRRVSRLALVAVLAGLFSPVLASPLDSKKNEWAFAISWTDVDQVGSTTVVDGQWQYIFAKGHHELGALLSYLSVDPDSGGSQDALIFGPSYTWNWMPDKKATGYLTAAYGFVSGDLGDFADAAWQAGVGAKVFVGDSAAVRFEYFMQTLTGAEGFEDQDSNGLLIGISIFTGK